MTPDARDWLDTRAALSQLQRQGLAGTGRAAELGIRLSVLEARMSAAEWAIALSSLADGSAPAGRPARK